MGQGPSAPERRAAHEEVARQTSSELGGSSINSKPEQELLSTAPAQSLPAQPVFATIEPPVSTILLPAAALAPAGLAGSSIPLLPPSHARPTAVPLSQTPPVAPQPPLASHPASALPLLAAAASPPCSATATAAAAPPSTAAAPAVPPAATTTSTAAPSTAAQPRAATGHKSTNLIPQWSRSLTSQSVQIECQKVSQPQKAPLPKDCYAVLELEVMKYVAYCGGVTVRFRVDELLHGTCDNVTFGLACTRPSPAVAAFQQQASSTNADSLANRAASAVSITKQPTRPGSASVAPVPTSPPKSPATTGVQVESVSRKPLYLVAAATTNRAVSTGDILTIELSPREERQPVIVTTLKLNDVQLSQQSLPCSSISSIQMYPYVTVQSGVSFSLHEATTPSPLFTWYSPMQAATSEASMCELDTCVKYHTSATASTNLQNGCGMPVDFQGSAAFSSGRHRWTVQLDNYGPFPTHIFVGITNAVLEPPVSSAAVFLQNVAGPLKAITGSARLPPSATPSSPSLSPLATSTPCIGSTAAPPSPAIYNNSVPSPPGTPPPLSPLLVPSSPADVAMPHKPPATKWGAWVKMPGTVAANNTAGPSPTAPPPFREGHTHATESTSAHCFITVDLDLQAGYVRFFRNGHLIVCPFHQVTGPVSPLIGFIQAPNANCQAGLVNLTKLRQLDLTWNTERCSGDLRLQGNSVSKVSEVYGDYSTVLATQGFINGVHLWLVKVNNLSEPDSIFIGVCRGCMPLDQDPQDLRDRTYYLSNGVIRVGGRRVATNAANFTKGDLVGVVLDADQGEIVFFRNGVEQGRARGIRGRLYPFVSCDSDGDNVTLLGSYNLQLNRVPRQLADMEWDTLNHATDVDLSSNCLTATKSAASNGPSTVRGTILYGGTGTYEFHVIVDNLGPDGMWVGVAPPDISAGKVVGDSGCGWSLHTDGDRRFDGKEEEFTQAFKNGDVVTVRVNLATGTLSYSRNGLPLGEAFLGLAGPLVAAVTLASEESKITIQNRPTVLNVGEYTGELRWDEARAGKDLHVVDGLTVTKTSNEGGDYATVLGTLCLASGQHSWNIYINHVEDSNLFIGVTVGGHDLNADPQEMKHRTYYLSNGTIRVAGKLITRCAEPYAEGDLVTVQLDMEARTISFLKNGVTQGGGDSLPEEVWPYVSLDNIMDSITLHSSSMFVDLAHSLRWNSVKAARCIQLQPDGTSASIKSNGEEVMGQATVVGVREYNKTEVHSWIVRFEQDPNLLPANFLVGVAPPSMDLMKSLGEEGCGIGIDYYGYFYVNGRYFHCSNLSNWQAVAKTVRGSTAKHKGKSPPIFTFTEGRCEVVLTLDLKEGTLRFSHAGRTIGTIASVKGPLHAAVTLTSSRQTCVLVPGPIGKSEQNNEELVNILKAKGAALSPKLEAALLLIPRDLFVPRDRHREAFRDQKVTVRMSDGSTMTLPPPSFVAAALTKLGLGPGMSFLDVGCGTGYVTALAACLLGPEGSVHGIECVSSRLEGARANFKQLKERLGGQWPPYAEVLGDVAAAVGRTELTLSNVLIPECTDGVCYDVIYCDASLSEEDLPAFLSLLKPNGRMVVLLDEEAVLITRNTADPHDFQRETIQQLSGEFGDLEEPTPWEVQEAIARMKERERRRGQDQAKADLTNLRNFEYTEMHQRLQSSMARIEELEGMLQRDPSLRSPVRLPMSPARSGMDDVRNSLKDKSRRSLNFKMSPRSLPRSPAGEKEDWAQQSRLMVESSARSRAKDLFSSDNDACDTTPDATQVPIDQQTLDDILDSITVQSFSVEQIESIINGSAPVQIENHSVYYGSCKGVKVRVWRVQLSSYISYLELRRTYSKYCVAHPNIASVLGVCIQQPLGDSPIPSPKPSNLSRSTDETSIEGDSSTEAASENILWIVEESFGEETLYTRLERGLLSWQQAVRVALDLCKALTFLQDLRQTNASLAESFILQPSSSLPLDILEDATTPTAAPSTPVGLDIWTPAHQTVLSAYALRTLVTPSNVLLDSISTKVSVLPALIHHLETVMETTSSAPLASNTTLLHCDLAYMEPATLLSESTSPSFYAFGIVLLQLLTEQGPLGLLSAVKEALDNKTLHNLVPRVPATPEMIKWATEFSKVAIKCTKPGAVNVLEVDVLPVLDELSSRLVQLAPSNLSWEQVEEMLMLPLQPRAVSDYANRRWVRQDFRLRRKAFLEEVAKLAVEGPIHKLEVRRARCFKDAVAIFAGKGHAVWRQPLKVTFVGEAGMDSGGVTREWFSTMSNAIARGSPDLFYPAGPQRQHLYINPLSSSPSHLKKFQFVGLFMAKAILETAARSKELGTIALNLSFCEPFWKLLLGIPLNLVDLQLLDPTEFRSLMSILQMDIDGLIFETFSWNFHPPVQPAGPESESNTPSAALPLLGTASSASFTGEQEDMPSASIALKPGGTHIKVNNHNKREYTLLKAHKMLVGTIEAQMSAVIDSFHSLIPRDLLDKYNFSSMEMQLLVCGEQRIDIQDLKRHCKYEDGYSGKEDIITWFWEVVEAFDDTHRRHLLQFWSGSDGMPAEGFGAVDPAFHMVAVERMYDANDTTARLPAAHTCFRQLDLPRYRSLEELREKLVCAITIGQGYMALS